MKKHNFNTPESLLVVTSYPDPEKGIKELNAVAWHSHKTLHAIAKDSPVIVLAEKINSKDTYRDGDNILVKRVWQRGSARSLFSIFRQVIQYYNVRNILFQFEFNIFGGLLPVLVLPIILLILKLLGKKVFFELHQVILDIKTLENHVNIKNRVVQLCFNIALVNFYRMIGKFSSGIIVFEEDLKERLSKLINPEKITILPLSVDTKKISTKASAKSKLKLAEKDFVVLVFGFVNWYKGSDWIVNLFAQNSDKNIKIILAGGENPTLKDKKYYRNFYEKILSVVNNHKNISITGFIPDNKIHTYFAAADVVVLPYRVFMSASGPFSLALSYKKPILLSDRLINYAKSSDIHETLAELQLDIKDVFFDLHSNRLVEMVKMLRKNESKLSQLTSFSEKLAARRSSEYVTQKYISLFKRSSYVKKDIFSFKKMTAYNSQID